MKKASNGALRIAFALCLIPGLAVADSVVFSNFGPGMTFDTNPANSYFVTGSSFPQSCPSGGSCVTSQVLGMQFMSSGNYDFTTAQAALLLEAGTNTIDAFIQQDMSGLPGSILSEFQIQNQMTASPAVVTIGQSQPGVTLLQGSANPELISGAPYWLVLAAPAADTKAAWAASLSDIASGILDCTSGCPSASTPSNFAYNTTPNSSTPTWIWFPGTITANGATLATFNRPAFQIDGTPVVTPPSTVPEPQTLVLMGAGLGAILLLAFRRRAAA